MSISFRARWVFPVDRPPIEGGYLTIDGDRIVDVGLERSGSTAVDLGQVALLPGLINAHTHLEFSNLRQPLGSPGMPLPAWIRLVIAERGKSPSPEGDPLEIGIVESLWCGVTTLADICTADHPSPLVDPSISLFEVIGFSQAHADSAFTALATKLDTAGDAWCRIGISPHAPYTVSRTLLEKLVTEAQNRELPVAMHLAESREEIELLRTGTGPFQELLDERSMWDADAIPPGSRPLDYLQLLSRAPRALVVHGNYLGDEERSFLAANRHRMSLVHCPRTHAYFDHSPYPLAEATAAGVRVVFGTDSRASNPDLDLFAEMQFAAAAHPKIAPVDVLRMGTLEAAEALGGASDVGSLSAGKFANFMAMQLPDGALGDAQAVLAVLLAAKQPPSRAVWLRGRRV